MIVLQQQLKLERVFVFSAISELLYVYPFKFEEFKFANCHLPCLCTGLAVLKLDTSAANGSLSLDGQARESKQTESVSISCKKERTVISVSQAA